MGTKADKVLLLVAEGDPALTAAQEAAARSVLAGAEISVERLAHVLALPQALALAERLAEFDGYVALGAVMLDEDVWAEVARALTALGMTGALNGNGIVLADSAEDALARAEGAAKGAAGSLRDLLALTRAWASATKGIGFRA